MKQKTAYEVGVRLVGSEMCIRDRVSHSVPPRIDDRGDGHRPRFGAVSPDHFPRV